MAEKKIIDAMWDDSPVDVSTEVNFIWSIANKLRGTYQSDKYKDVIIPMVIIRRFECALAPTKAKVVETYKANPNYPAKAMYRAGARRRRKRGCDGDVPPVRLPVLQHPRV